MIQPSWHVSFGCQSKVKHLLLKTKRKFRIALLDLDKIITNYMHVFYEAQWVSFAIYHHQFKSASLSLMENSIWRVCELCDRYICPKCLPANIDDEEDFFCNECSWLAFWGILRAQNGDFRDLAPYEFGIVVYK